MNPHAPPSPSGPRPARQLLLTTLVAAALVLAAAPAFGLDGDGNGAGEKKVEREVRVVRLHPDGTGEGDRTVKKERRVVVLGDGDGDGSHGFAFHDGDRPLRLGTFLSGGYLGVELSSLTPELRSHFGAPDDAGVMVSRVQEGSPAEAAGLQVGDVITSVDGEAVSSAQLVGIAVRSHEPGETVDLVVVRDGRALDFEVEVGERQRQALDLAPLLEWRDENGEVDLKMLHEGAGPRVFQFHSEDGAEPMVFEFQGLEGLGRSLEGMDWNQLVGPRQETLQRIEELEKRLQELERELERARRDR